MPVSVIDIPVNDEAFQRFLGVFGKYQEALKSQPDLWGETSAAMSGIAMAGAAIAAELAHQAEETRRLGQEERKREAEKKEAAAEETRRDKETAKREEAAKKRRRQIIDDIKEFGRTSLSVVEDLAKWTTVGGGASLAAGAVGFWGLDKFVAGVGEERRLAQGFGVSMGERQSSAINLQRYFDVNQTLGSIAEAQQDPSKWGALVSMGLNPRNGEDPARLMTDAALAARRIFLEGNQSLLYAQARGLTQFFSPEDLRRLAATPEGQLRQSINESRALAKNAGLSDEVGRKWQNFIITLDTAGLKLKNALIDKLTTLEPDLEVLTKKFTELALTVLDRIDFKKLGDGLDLFTKYISSGEFQKNFKIFIDDIVLIAEKIAKGLEMLGIIPGPIPGTEQSGPATGIPNAGVGLAPSNAGIIDLPIDPIEIAAGVISMKPSLIHKGLHPGGYTESRGFEKQAMDWAAKNLQNWGWTVPQTQGIMANIESESDFNPFAEGDWVYANGAPAPAHAKGAHYLSYGIGQWKEDRRADYAKLFHHTMESVRDSQQALTEQLEFYQWEMVSPKSKYRQAGIDLRNTRDAYHAGAVVATDMERMKDKKNAPGERGKLAMTITVKPIGATSVNTQVNAASR